MSELNELLNSFSRIVFLTGAGVSTASGIPDYRSTAILAQQIKIRQVNMAVT